MVQLRVSVIRAFNDRNSMDVNGTKRLVPMQVEAGVSRAFNGRERIDANRVLLILVGQQL